MSFDLVKTVQCYVKFPASWIIYLFLHSGTFLEKRYICNMTGLPHSTGLSSCNCGTNSVQKVASLV